MLERLLETYIQFKHSEEGQGMVEYALVLVFVVAVAAIALTTATAGGLGSDIKSKLDGIFP
jgi:Flp pilus assembly pilin Flp